MKHVFYDATGLVKQVIVANISQELISVFLSDYSKLFNAVAVESVSEDNEVWIGWKWTGSEFVPPVEVVADAAPVESETAE